MAGAIIKKKFMLGTVHFSERTLNTNIGEINNPAVHNIVK